MAETHVFTGKTLFAEKMELGEGPTYDRTTNTAWWFNILGRTLHELQLDTGTHRAHPLPRLASVLARVDEKTQAIVMEDGVYLRDLSSGALTLHAAVEADRPENRCNDGRVHPSGALWFGTMGKKAEDGAGSIYHVARGVVTKLFGDLSITNGICFSPDGATGYFVDTKVNRYMRVALDPATGVPSGEPTVLIDETGQPGGMDGAVCDADGHIWNARWGEGRVDRYAPDGALVARYLLPASQGSCPAFIGPDLDRLLVTSAYEGLDGHGSEADGLVYELGVSVKGVAAPDYRT